MVFIFLMPCSAVLIDEHFFWVVLLVVRVNDDKILFHTILCFLFLFININSYF